MNTKQKYRSIVRLRSEQLQPLLKELQKLGGSATVGSFFLKQEDIEHAIALVQLLEKDYKDWLYTGAPKEVTENLRATESLFANNGGKVEGDKTAENAL